MNMPLTIRRTHRPRTPVLWSWRSLQWLVFAAIAAWSLHVFMQPASADANVGDTPSTTSIPAVVHWKDTANDWLLVVDQSTHELVVYDANSGRPLRRVGVASGAGPIDSITGEGRWLITMSQHDAHLQVLSLPELQPAMLATR